MNIRKATMDDALFVSQCLDVTNYNEYSHYLDQFVCAMFNRDDVLYNCKNSIIAEVDGVRAGLIIPYGGDEYVRYFEANCRAFDPNKRVTPEEFECKPDEYHFEALAVLPEFRHRGIGSALVRYAEEQGRTLGFTKITLAVEQKHPELKDYYHKLGYSDLECLTSVEMDLQRMGKSL